PWPRRDLTVTNCAGVLAPFLAETVIAGIMAVNANLLRYAAQQRQALWRPIAFQPLAGRTLLVVGLGAIGGHVARPAQALGMTVLAIRRQETTHPAVDELHPPAALLDLVARADVISLHVRLDSETRGMIGRPVFERCKAGAILVNTARGPVVDEAALVSALQEGRIGGAYLDVFESEPLSAASPLWALPNVLITPHASDNVADWPLRLASFFADNLESWNSGRPLFNEIAIGRPGGGNRRRVAQRRLRNPRAGPYVSSESPGDASIWKGRKHGQPSRSRYPCL